MELNRWIDERQVAYALRNEKEQAEGLHIGRYSIARAFFHEGQSVAWRVRSAMLLLLCGKQSGKTTFGVNWLAREIQERGPGDYAIVGPSLPILNKKALNEAKRFFVREEKLATYNTNDKAFTFTEEGLQRIFGTSDRIELYHRFAHTNDETGAIEPFELFEAAVRIHVIPAIDENALESGTYKAVWGDEMGHPRVKVNAHENIMARLAAFNGRVCYTTTPYALNWLKTRVFDKITALVAPKEGWGSQYIVGEDAKMACVRFESWMNPHFGKAKFEEMRASGIPKWRFDLFFRGIFTRPAGQIFDCFDRATMTTKYGPVPKDYPRLWGHDFGGRNYACSKVCFDIVGKQAILYSTYHVGQNRTIEEHIQRLFSTDVQPKESRGGAPSEEDWRNDFKRHGLPIKRPSVGDHEVRIQILYQLLAQGKLLIMDHLEKLLLEIEDYSREVDDDGEPTKEIENKSQYHRLDSVLYMVPEIQASLLTLDAA